MKRNQLRGPDGRFIPWGSEAAVLIPAWLSQHRISGGDVLAALVRAGADELAWGLRAQASNLQHASTPEFIGKHIDDSDYVRRRRRALAMLLRFHREWKAAEEAGWRTEDEASF